MITLLSPPLALASLKDSDSLQLLIQKRNKTFEKSTAYYHYRTMRILRYKFKKKSQVVPIDKFRVLVEFYANRYDDFPIKYEEYCIIRDTLLKSIRIHIKARKTLLEMAKIVYKKTGEKDLTAVGTLVVETETHFVYKKTELVEVPKTTHETHELEDEPGKTD